MHAAPIRVVPLLLLPAAVQAWTTISQTQSVGPTLDTIKNQFDPDYSGSLPTQRLGYIWSEPADITDTSGLGGGGLTYAFDPTMCKKLLPQFSESAFFVKLVTCDTIKAAIGRGFQTWSDNNGRVNFLDVTDECLRLGTLVPTCSLAKIWVTWLDPSTGQGSTNNFGAGRRLSEAASPNVSVSVTNDALGGGTVVALAETQSRQTTTFRSTNGFRPTQYLYESHRATMSFNIEECWYLDATFCSGFHKYKEQVGVANAKTGVMAITWGLFVSACFAACYFSYRIVMKVQERDSKKETICHAALHALAHQGRKHGVLLWTCILLFMVAPISFHVQIFLPCFNCFDFEAAATHEIGHILGFGHPDTDPATVTTSAFVNMYNPSLINNRWDAQTCNKPWESVTAGVPLDAKLNKDGFRPSIMLALTQHNPKTCLEHDDLEALSTMYPDCDRAISTPVCYKLQHYLGFLRLTIWIIVPILLILAFMVAVNTVVARNQAKRHKLQERQLKTQQEELEATKSEHRKAENELSMATSKLEYIKKKFGRGNSMFVSERKLGVATRSTGDRSTEKDAHDRKSSFPAVIKSGLKSFRGKFRGASKGPKRDSSLGVATNIAQSRSPARAGFVANIPAPSSTTAEAV